MRLSLIVALAGGLTLTGCHSAYIDATIANHSGAAINLVEVDYPSASFGTQNLAAGAEFHYRFKVLGSGPTTVLWTDAAHHDHKNTGPSMEEKDEGRLTVTIDATGASWQETLTGSAPR
jgi:hypothetical protein